MKLALGAPIWLTALLLSVATSAQFTCSPTQPCEIGCCTKFGSCGLGPDSCGPENCISNCDRKSDCDPGWGAQWSNAEECPLKVCCSKFGFCGTTSDFCGNATVTAPSCSGGSSSSKRTIGYYEAWSVTRPCDKMYPESIPIGSYTHLNFAFAFVNPTTFALSPMSDADPALYKRFTALKNTNPGLQTWISIGGWSMNDPDQPTATTFSDLAGSSDAQSKFFASVLSFLETYGFDGVDIDWEYPVAPERSGKPDDYKNYVTFLQNLRNALHSTGHNYGLTITIPSSFWYLQHFDIVNIEKTIDWFNLMSYDLHGTWDSTNKFLGPYIAAHTNLTEIDEALSLLWRNKINPDNVVLGLGFYGRSFTLADPSCNTPGCVFTSGGDAGTCTQSVGTLSFAEIQRLVAAGAHVATDTKAAVKMVTYNNNQWVSYDDSDTFKMKIDYANSHCLGGTMVWASSTDDAKGNAAGALSKSTGRQALSLLATKQSDPITSCQLGECGKSCPAGLSPAQRSDGKNRGNTGTNTGCSGDDMRLYCCPSNDMPTCTWRGGAPFCNGKCHDGEVEVTSSTTGTGAECWTGHKVLCCLKTASDQAVSECHWSGSAPICSAPFSQAGCPDGQKALTNSNYGAGGEQPCAIGDKSFCCDQPPPYENCDWYYHGGKFLGQIPFVCTGTCPAGKSVIATDPTGCWSGYGAFCCDNPTTTNDPLVADFTKRIQAFSSDATCKVGQIQYSREIDDILSRLDKRTTLSNADMAQTLQQLTQLVSGNGQTYQQNLMESAFDTIYGASHGLFVSNISSYFGDWPNMDQLSLSESLLCMGNDAINFLADYHSSRTQVCTNSCNLVSRRDTSASDFWHRGFTSFENIDNVSSTASEKASLLSRNLGDSEHTTNTGPDGEPSWGFMVEAILNGQMTIEYEQMILATGSGSEETILEVVWNLPSGSGAGGINSNFQDENPSDAHTNPDRYVVFHFHTDHIRQATATHGAAPGIHAVVAFHGQFRRGNNGRGRVDNQDPNRNRRARVLNCGNQNDLFWYPGDDNDNDNHLNEWAALMTRFGNYMINNGIMTLDTYTGSTRGQLVLNPPDDCGRQTFNWGGYRQSRMFQPGNPNQPGGSGSQNPNGDPGQDNDGV
ncbi:Chitotriosidase-1 [Psilocybe cubensis]|uniref:Chitinase n=2 Tax=Psilocybe cubensis TaxID=181762 RepID=A0A8H8CJX9_PSICU|nr:Chitotriosidase-1 [Psilocybe cubensis]KAH9478589.1 Chitotriosidase-1 [Psilocybe cubensis]